jgi:hypothetical protein
MRSAGGGGPTDGRTLAGPDATGIMTTTWIAAEQSINQTASSLESTEDEIRFTEKSAEVIARRWRTWRSSWTPPHGSICTRRPKSPLAAEAPVGLIALLMRRVVAPEPTASSAGFFFVTPLRKP